MNEKDLRSKASNLIRGAGQRRIKKLIPVILALIGIDTRLNVTINSIPEI